jgi:hypothetical protein
LEEVRVHSYPLATVLVYRWPINKNCLLAQINTA